MIHNPNNYTKYTFFWSGPFSNWADAPMIIDGITYNCCEQYMMLKKALTFPEHEINYEIADRIMETTQPREQKALGREVRGFEMNRWGTVARDIVFRGNLAKYTQNKDMFDYLMETAGTLLVEASPMDKVWGIGLDARTAAITPIGQWEGKNWLGQVLTEIRDTLQASVHLHSTPYTGPMKLNHK
jgi:ribA/ribD-fused uncharacterized protein